MACNSTVEKNQNFTSSKDVEKNINDQDYIWSCRWENYRHEGPSNLKQKMKGTFQSTELMDQKNIFRNYKRKRKDESRSSSSSTSKFIRTNSPSIPLIPPRASASTGGFRRVSFLERALFPGVNVDAVLPAPTPTEESKTAPLTIFYAGVINVYDDVPLDKKCKIIEDKA
ncbi:hypothetical protein M9H77_20955 [Catharanthus roseus]|uniref:Uncharacterized protein n=1 Tax=Catharanthus roseus TaxID=4058 RepID=A0ACC0AKY3_CATRO|nr:hypothetical protein M9H77_20955 [Catharanthus roseus]